VSEPSEWIAVGQIARAHGVKGEVSVVPLTEVDVRFEPGSRVFAGERRDRELTVASARPHHGRLIVAFEGVGDRAEAEDMRGLYLFVPAASAPELPEGTYWAHQLVGCEVVTVGGRSLGRIREVVGAPAGDVWVADGDGGEVLLPALKEVVQRVDLDGRRVVVHEVPGLTGP
jgi:16S rRNA processing protein RimM